MTTKPKQEIVKLSTLEKDIMLVSDENTIKTAGELVNAVRSGAFGSSSYAWHVGVERKYIPDIKNALDMLYDHDEDNGLPDSLIDDARTAIETVLPELQVTIKRALEGVNTTYFYGSGQCVEIDIQMELGGE